MAYSSDSAVPEVRLQLLGRWQLSSVDGNVTVRADRTSQKLLALLALRGTLSRPQIWGILWPDSTTARASGCLRTAVWRLAASQVYLLKSSPRQLGLPPIVHVDVTEMYAAAAALDGNHHHFADHTEISLFVADLLPDWDDEWLLESRERIRQLRLHTLEALSAQLVQEHRFGAAVDSALAAVSVDPLRESAQRALIFAHLAQGNTAAALHQFGLCRTLYAQELDTVPSPELFALVAQFTTDSPRQP